MNKYKIQILYQQKLIKKSKLFSIKNTKVIKAKFRQKQKHQIDKHNLQKLYVGSGFTFDMTDYHKFSYLHSKAKDTTLQLKKNKKILFLILLLTVISTASVPGWLMTIKANKLLRVVWRFFIQFLLTIPFVMYEKRNNNKQQQKYNVNYIFNSDHIIKPYIASLAQSLWAMFVMTSFQWTHLSHCFVFGSLVNFYASLNRSFNKLNHPNQTKGQILVIIGILIVIFDSYTMQQQYIHSQYSNNFVYKRLWWQRVLMDLSPLIGSFVLYKASFNAGQIKNHYPPLLSFSLVNMFNILNISIVGYFTQGLSFDFDSFWGFFGLITEYHMTQFLFFAIIITIAQLTSMIIVSKSFDNPIIPAAALTFQPYIGFIIVYIVSVQKLPNLISIIGFFLILPGSNLILIGQHAQIIKKINE